MPRPKHRGLFAKICAALWVPHGMPKDALLADLSAGELASASLPYVLDLGRGLAVVSSECSGCRSAPIASLRHVGRRPPKGEIEREVAPRFHCKLLHLRGRSVKGHALERASCERQVRSAEGAVHLCDVEPPDILPRRGTRRHELTHVKCPFRSHACRNVNVIKAAIAKGLLRLCVRHIAVASKHKCVECQLYVVQNGVSSALVGRLCPERVIYFGGKGALGEGSSDEQRTAEAAARRYIQGELLNALLHSLPLLPHLLGRANANAKLLVSIVMPVGDPAFDIEHRPCFIDGVTE